MDKNELFKTLNFIKKNKDEINKRTIVFTDDSDEFSYVFCIYPFSFLLFGGIISATFFLTIQEWTEGLKAFYFLSNFILLFLNIIPSYFLSKFLVKKILGNKNKKDDYSIYSCLFKSKKDFIERKTLFKNLNKLLKNNLSKKIMKAIRSNKYSKLLEYNYYNRVDVKLLNIIKKEYIENHSKEKLMKSLSEYLVINFKKNNTLDILIKKEILEYYQDKKEELIEKKNILEVSGLSTENLEIKKEIIGKINNNNKKLKILSI
jgi:hypothetical protein